MTILPDPKELSNLRNKIDDADWQIVALICQRADLARQIGHIKRKQNAPVYRPDREREVHLKLKESLQKNDKPEISFAALQRIYREIIAASIELEGSPKISYLGPPASFSHVALQSCFGSAACALAQKSIADVFRSVELSQGSNYGIVPIDNIK